MKERVVTAQQLAEGYVLRWEDGSIERRPFRLLKALPNGTMLVEDPRVEAEIEALVDDPPFHRS